MVKPTSIHLSEALIITRREVRDQLRDWRIIFPILVLTLFFPGLMNFTAQRIVTFVQRFGAPIVGERLIPFLLLIVGFFPISVSLVIALESFVGEKERRSIEPLLGSPLSDRQIYLGKLLAALLPPLLLAYLGIIVYLVGVYFQVGWKPPPVLLVQVILLTAVQALLMVSGAVVISSQSTSVRSANLMASFIIIPMVLLIQAEAMIMFWARYDALWWVIMGQVFIAFLLIRTGVAHFNREELLGRELDTLNLAWVLRQFRQSFIGKASSVGSWYSHELRGTLRKMRLPAVIMTFALVAATLIGAQQANVFVLPPELLNWENLDRGSLQGLERIQLFSASGIGTVWLHNLRAIALATVLGIFSFGILGVLVLMVPFFLIGYFMASLASAGLPVTTFSLAVVLPHGILEIPAIILAGAAILHLGATLATPAQGKTIGEAWIAALADWAKIMLSVVLPLLLGAAVLEILVTPRIAIWLLGG
jgi:uncharacterized membrane protein SpoIIM required for sporulation/ABC-type transport system involved in multi-copper enzyme maturation permease subunit